MIRRPPRSTPFPTRRSSDLQEVDPEGDAAVSRGGLSRLRDDGIPRPFRDHRGPDGVGRGGAADRDRKSTRLNSSHSQISYAVFCLKKKKKSKDACETLRSDR